MKKNRVQDKFFEELERTPIIQAACERSGISRNTFYRWIKEDEDFAFRVKEAHELGIEYVNDHAESNILNGIKKGDLGSTKYWLSSRHESYRRPFLFRDRVQPEKADPRELQRKRDKILKWQKQWEHIADKEKQEEAKKLFEQWKRNKKNEKDKPPEIT